MTQVLPTRQALPDDLLVRVILLAIVGGIGLLFVLTLFGGIFAAMVAGTRTRGGGDFSYWVVGTWARSRVYGPATPDIQRDVGRTNGWS
jgi:hypothetical protein